MSACARRRVRRRRVGGGFDLRRDAGRSARAHLGWIDAHFAEQVRFLQERVRVRTDTPPGNNAPHAERAAELLQAFGFEAEKHRAQDFLTALVKTRLWSERPAAAA